MKRSVILLLFLSTLSIYAQETGYAKETEVKELMPIDPIENIKDVPFKILEEVPVHPDCKTIKGREEIKKCFNMAMIKHVQKHFNAELSSCIEKRVLYNYKKKKDEEVCIGLAKGKKRIYILFKINQEGNVVDINVNAPHPKLKEEGIRIAKLLPKMEPGRQEGVPVRVGYTLPIIFNVD